MGLFDFFRRKKSTNGSHASGVEVNATRHCFVLCKSAEPGNLSRASEIAARVYGRGYSAEVSDRSLVTVSRGEEAVGFIAFMPAPIPDGEAERYADGNFLWPYGEIEAGKHQSHLIVTTMGAGDQKPIPAAIALSKLTLVALELFDGLGVYWGNASVSNSREAFEAFCKDVTEDQLPIPVWLRFQLVRAAGDEVGIYTLGMDQFGLMDIEADRSPMDVQELFEFVSNLAAYLIKSGPIIADGNTVGGSAEQRILVRHRPSMIDKKRRVYKIVFE